jgi:hypothetical protein
MLEEIARWGRNLAQSKGRVVDKDNKKKAKKKFGYKRKIVLSAFSFRRGLAALFL